MADLTDEELSAAVTLIDSLRALNRNAFVDPQALRAAAVLSRAALEVERHRAAISADKERVRAVVDAVAMRVLVELENYETHDEAAHQIANRAADQLATPAVRLTEEERYNLGDVRAHLGKRPYLWSDELATLDRLIKETP